MTTLQHAFSLKKFNPRLLSGPDIDVLVPLISDRPTLESKASLSSMSVIFGDLPGIPTRRLFIVWFGNGGRLLLVTCLVGEDILISFLAIF